MITFGKKLRDLRQQKNLSQRNLSKIIGVGYTTIANWEVDRNLPNNATILKIANYFNVSVDYLIGNDNPPPPLFTYPEFSRALANAEIDDEDFKQLSAKDKEQLISVIKKLLDNSKS